MWLTFDTAVETPNQFLVPLITFKQFTWTSDTVIAFPLGGFVTSSYSLIGLHDSNGFTV